jgi:putative glycosyltransferase
LAQELRRVQLSVVASLYRSGEFIAEFHRRMTDAAAAMTSDYELIVVNDGSPDQSLELARRLVERDPHLVLVDLSRNFGHHRAMMTGLRMAKGRLVFLIDVDLEEKPEWLKDFHAEMERTGADVVYGVQSSRKGSWFERVIGGLFYDTFNRLLESPIPKNILTARLMTRRYVKGLVAYREREINLSGLGMLAGFVQVPLAVAKTSRNDTSYSLARRIAVFVDAVTSFSNRPLLFVFYLGSFIVAVSGVAAAVLIVRRVVFQIFLPGWPSLIVSVWLLGGLTIFCIGVVGVYLAKVFTETKRRPVTIIRHIYRHEGGAVLTASSSAGRMPAPEP